MPSGGQRYRSEGRGFKVSSTPLPAGPSVERVPEHVGEHVFCVSAAVRARSMREMRLSAEVARLL